MKATAKFSMFLLRAMSSNFPMLSMYSRRVILEFYSNFPHNEFKHIFAMKCKPGFGFSSSNSIPNFLALFQCSSSEQLNGDVSNLNFINFVM